MQAKQIVSLLLLLFMGASVLYLTINETGMSSPDVLSNEAQTLDQVDQSQSGRVVTVTYFYGNTRCATCNKLETYSHKAVNSHLATYIDDDRLVWQTINYEEPPNEHFIDDYQLAYQSLILQEFVDGEPGKFVNLNRIWGLVSDEEAFVGYVAEEITAFMEQP